MAYRTWNVEKVRYCERIGQEVTLETEVVYPAEYLPDQPPRILAHRCSHALICNLFDRAVCKWSGTNPDYEPI